MQTNWVSPSEAKRFCENDAISSPESFIVTLVESSHSAKNVTGVESESPNIVTRVELS